MLRRLLALMLVMLLVAACQTTGDTNNQSTSAQTYMPNITGYRITESNSIIDAVTAAGAGAALSSGNVPLAAGIARAEAVMQCMEDTGAVAANIFVEEQPWEDMLPEAGAVAIINQARFSRNLVNCLTTSGDTQMRSFSVMDETCTQNGAFTISGEQFNYIFVGAGNDLCGYFTQHFSAIQANNAD